MPQHTSQSFRLTVGVVAVSALLALSACAPEPETEPTPTAAPETTAPEPYAGPAEFVGDELEGLLLTAEEIATALPGAADIGAPTDVLEQISDGGGPSPMPEVCMALFMEQSLGSIGSRTAEWNPAGESEYDYGRMHVLQFADEAQAQQRMDQVTAAAEQCSSFDYNGPASFEAVVPEASDNVRTMAGVLMLPELEGGWKTFSAYATVGNVLVQVSQSVDGDAAPDAQAVAGLMQERAEEARATLIEQLTATPPAEEEEPAVDAAAPWGDWEVAPGGVGPIRLGDAIDAAVASGQAAQTIEPQYEAGPWKLVNESGSASLLLKPTEDGATAAAITVGNDRSFDDVAQDGAVLPSARGVRVGAPVADAIAAFPEGTKVTVISSGDEWYDVATRDGHLFRFHSDRPVVEPDALIVGITVEDATLRTSPVIG